MEEVITDIVMREFIPVFNEVAAEITVKHLETNPPSQKIKLPIRDEKVVIITNYGNTKDAIFSADADAIPENFRKVWQKLVGIKQNSHLSYGYPGSWSFNHSSLDDLKTLLHEKEIPFKIYTYAKFKSLAGAGKQKSQKTQKVNQKVKLTA